MRTLFAVFALDAKLSAKRPLFWILVIILALVAWGVANGGVRVSSGNADTGGAKAFMTSEFANARLLSILVFFFYTFFIAVAAGLTIIRDEELKVGPILHATPLTVGQYIWGKFGAVVASFVVVLALHLAFSAFAHYFLAGAKNDEFIGPFRPWNYIAPALIFALPQILFVGGVSFALGAITRRPILVFVLPVALFLVNVFFLLDWSPAWLDPRIDHLLAWLEPSGSRWLETTWLKVDRGVAFYNTQSIALDWPFALSRLAMIAIGLASVAWSVRSFRASLRGTRAKTAGVVQPGSAENMRAEVPRLANLGSLSMSIEPPGLLRGIAEVARVEFRELRSQAGLYIFVPLILLQTISVGLFRTGAFDTPLLATPGTLAASTMNTLTLLVCFLLLFYTVESLERERANGFDMIHGSTSVRSASILFGKSIANSLVGVVVLLAAVLANAIVLLVQHKVPFELRPFLILWGLLLVPTFIAWTSFVAMVQSLVRNRYGSYAIGLVVLAFTGWAQFRGWVTWTGNWNLWNTVAWSDMSVLELGRGALIWNRILVLTLAVLFTAVAVRMYPRRQLDAVNIARRLQPGPMLRGALWPALLALPPIACAIVLHVMVNAGFQGDAREKAAKDYWRKNIETWKDAPTPAIRDVTLDLALVPIERSFHAKGAYVLENDKPSALAKFPITPGPHYEQLKFTFDGEPATFENRSGLYILSPKTPLAPGARTTLGFEYDGVFPKGSTKNGGGASEFILGGGVVLTSFGPSFVPMLGFADSVGVDEDNRSDAKDYADDYYVGQTDSAFGTNTPYTTNIRVTVPEGWRANSVGTLTSDEAHDGQHTFTWTSDHPVTFFNVVAGHWSERKGAGTTIYYHPAHTYNIEEMGRALDAARKHYSEWFYPFPWQELKLSEFPNLATYAQGFPSNITFSEGIGFLTESDERANVAFAVTAHESAHQWWGNILNPGKGPGGNILSEGMAHFSTILLEEAELGPRARIAFAKQIEAEYGNARQVDSERPLVKCDGSRPGDTSVTYDKGGWVFWMLLNHMGRENALAGLKAFIRKYEKGPDHPVLQDFVADMRPFAPDPAAYDAFVKPWFFEVVVPEYKIEHETRTKLADGAWEVRASVKNVGTASMPLTVAATRGERFADSDAQPKPALESAAAATASVQAAETKPGDKPAEPYLESRTEITLGAGESKEIVLRCEFEPQQLLVDPDALVLQLNRKLAIARF
jgi:ABC-2 type transport system permease protein